MTNLESCTWIVCHDATQGRMAYAMECQRCGAIQRVAVPFNIRCYVAMADEFQKIHSQCKEATE